MRAALVGAKGARAVRLARDLLEWPEVAHLTVVDPDPDAVERIASSAPNKVSPVAVDLKTRGLADSLKEVDVAIGSGLEFEVEAAVASAALSVGTPYLSTSDDTERVEALLEMDDEARSQGALIVAGMGWSPGITNLLAAMGIASMDEARDVRVSWVTSAAGSHRAAVFERAVKAFSGVAPVFERGSWHREPAGGRSEEVYFPEPLGWLRVQLCSGAETLSLPKVFPTLSQVVVFGGLSEVAIDRAARGAAKAVGRGAITKLSPLLKMTSPLLPVLEKMGGSRQSWSAARVDVTGTSAGLQQTHTFAVMDHQPNLISAPVLVAASMISDGWVEAKGSIPPEAVFGPIEFFRRLAERGVKVARLER